MPNNDVQSTQQMERQRDCSSYVSRSMVMYKDGGGSSSNRSSSNSSSSSSSSSNRNSNHNSGNGRGGGGDSSSSGNGGSDFDDDCKSWSVDGISNAGANGSLSSGSADEGCYSDDGENSSTTRSGGSSSDGSGSGSSDGSGGGNKRKWLISLRTVIDRMVGSERKGRSKKRVVKSILRPPTTYKYVIGMSGFPSKVPVYPKTTMM